MGKRRDTRPSLESLVELVRYAAELRGESEELIADRIRAVEILWYHSPGSVHPDFLMRATNFIANPDSWDDWLEAGGNEMIGD